MHIHTQNKSQLLDRVNLQRTDVFIVSEAVMRKVSGVENVEGMSVVAELDRPRAADFTKSRKPIRRLLALEGIQDPGNVGTLLRTAVAFGWDGVFLLPGCCDLFNEKAIRASKGACFRLPWAQGTWDDLSKVGAHFDLPFLAAEPEPPKVAPLSPVARKREAACLVLGTILFPSLCSLSLSAYV